MVIDMDEVSDLKNVLEKIEGKLIAARKMYVAMTFAFWLIIMLLYYVIFPYVKVSPLFTAIYWIVAIGIYFWISSIILKNYARLNNSSNHLSKKHTGMFIAISWIVGSFIGWFLIPNLKVDVNSLSLLASGFLSFISISMFGEWLWFQYCYRRWNNIEMIPAFVIPAAGIPFALNMGNDSMVWAGFIVALAFSITIFWYLYSAFKSIR